MTIAATQDTSAVYSEFAADPDYREILELFAEALPERRQTLIDVFRSGDRPALRTLAHQLKGAGGGFGFRELTTLAAALEEACRHGQPDEVAAAVDSVLTYMLRITL